MHLSLANNLIFDLMILSLNLLPDDDNQMLSTLKSHLADINHTASRIAAEVLILYQSANERRVQSDMLYRSVFVSKRDVTNLLGMLNSYVVSCELS